MTDSYLAPEDLAAARRRINQLVGSRCRAIGLEPSSTGAVVVLEPGPLTPQLAQITGATACVTADFVLWRLGQSELDALAAALVPDRTLLFLEPTADLGWRRLIHRFGRPLWRLRLGHHFEADVPAMLRAAGLVVTTTDRFAIGGRGIKTYVWGEARHFPGK